MLLSDNFRKGRIMPNVQGIQVQVDDAELGTINLRMAVQHRNKQYRPTVGAIVEDIRGDILLVRSTKSGNWGFPQGGVDPGEDVVSGLLRELKEETRVVPVAVLKFCFDGGQDIPDMDKDGFTEGKWLYYFHAVCRGRRPQVTLKRDEIADYVWLSPVEVATVLSKLDGRHRIKKQIMLTALDKAQSA